MATELSFYVFTLLPILKNRFLEGGKKGRGYICAFPWFGGLLAQESRFSKNGNVTVPDIRDVFGLLSINWIYIF